MNRSIARPIALIGLMGAGKTAVARVLGERLGVAVADIDAMVEAEEGMSVSEIFAREGEAWFRRREGELLGAALASGARVVACGGGIVLDAAARKTLDERCDTVWLEVSPAEAARRLEGAVHERPLLAGADPASKLASLLASRTQQYEASARHRVATDGLAPDAVADAVLQAVGGSV